MTQCLAPRHATPFVRGRLAFPFPRNHRELLSDLLTPERVKVPLVSQSKDEVLRELVQLAIPSAGEDALERIMSDVRDRAQVRALSRISRILRHEAVREELSHASNAETFLQRLVGAGVP